MDGVPFVVQDPIMPGQVVHLRIHAAPGTAPYFYHAHFPMQEAIGMVGLFIIHPRQAYQPVVDQDFAIIAQEFAIGPASDYARHDQHGLQLPDLQWPLRAVLHADRLQAGQPRPHPRGQLQHGRPSPDPHARPHLLGDGHGRRPHAGIGLDPRQQRAGRRGPGARLRVHRQQPRRLGDALPHVPSHDESHDLRRGSRQSRDGQAGPGGPALQGARLSRKAPA